VGLVLARRYGWGTQDIVVVPATLVSFVYVVGMAAGTRLLTGGARVTAALALALTLCALPFALHHLLVPMIVAAAALGYRRVRQRRGGGVSAGCGRSAAAP
jgi:amino acid efflux transporter